MITPPLKFKETEESRKAEPCDTKITASGARPGPTPALRLQKPYSSHPIKFNLINIRNAMPLDLRVLIWNLQKS